MSSGLREKQRGVKSELILGILSRIAGLGRRGSGERAEGGTESRVDLGRFRHNLHSSLPGSTFLSFLFQNEWRGGTALSCTRGERCCGCRSGEESGGRGWWAWSTDKMATRQKKSWRERVNVVQEDKGCVAHSQRGGLGKSAEGEQVR